MIEALRIVQAVLAGETEPGDGKAGIAARMHDLTPGRNRTIMGTAYRLCRCLEQVEEGYGEGASWDDIAGQLRQALLFFNRRLVVSASLVAALRPRADRFQLRFLASGEVEADSSLPAWLDEGGRLADHLFRVPLRRRLKPALGDGLLYRFSGAVSYLNQAQKEVVRAAFALPPGSTLLACLPTGGGKTLAAQLPAFGSSLAAGTGSTVVVVPLTSLALDQEKRARESFSAWESEHGRRAAYAYHSGVPRTAREEVREGLLKGTLPLVFTSPEAILTGSLHDVLLEAARAHTLRYLVVDEAHTVTDWGGAFRTDFQVLAAYRRRLLAAGDANLRTILLSATMTDHTTAVLRQLFAEPGRLVELRGDALRPEPVYCADRSATNRDRRDRILQALPLLPKPLVLYVTRPETAELWRQWVQDEGFRRVGAFTGQTPAGDREHLLERWREDEIDIMIATSAFGLGVDKPDVRTILHCCLPETVNRFYQEVGRAGRDGCASLSLLSVVPETDFDETFSLVNKKVLTTAKMVKRWEAMRRSPAERLNGDTFWADTDTKPEHLADRETGSRSAHYNEITLLFLYRMGLIELLDARPGAHDPERRQILVKLKRLDVLDDSGLLGEALEPLREEEWVWASNGFQRMQALAEHPRLDCWGRTFAGTYPQVEEHCSGCPACTDVPLELEVGQDVRISRYGGGSIPPCSRGASEIRALMSGAREILLYLDAPAEWPPSSEMIALLGRLAAAGASQFVVPDSEPDAWKTWLPRLSTGATPGWYSEFSEVRRQHGIAGTVVLVYPEDSVKAEEYYAWSQRYLKEGADRKVIHVAVRDLPIPGGGKTLGNLVDGCHYRAARFGRE